jgi:nitrogen fixation NifU-like protein
MNDLRDLYQEIILDHNRNPRNFRKIEGATVTLEGHNPLCGDRYTIYLLLDDDIVKDISFTGAGCAISKASASVMTAMLKGKTRAEAEALFQQFHEVATGHAPISSVQLESLGKLGVFAGVREFPMRVKCATLAWHTMHNGLEGKHEGATTE